MLHTDFARRGVPWMALLLRSRTVPRHLNLGWRHRVSAAASLLALVAIARRRPALLTGAVLALVGLNRSLYALVLRRRGPLGVLAGLCVHVLHHLAATASVAAGIAVDALGAGDGRTSKAWSRDGVPPGDSPLPVPIDETAARPP
jgi:hypothetical protein